MIDIKNISETTLNMREIPTKPKTPSIVVQPQAAEEAHKIPSAVVEALHKVPDGATKDQLIALTAAITAVKITHESGDDASARFIASQADSIIDDTNTDSDEFYSELSSFSGTIQALIDWVSSINDLQKILSKMTGDLTQLVQKFSDKQNEVLSKDRDNINEAYKKDDHGSNSAEIQRMNNTYQQHEAEFRNLMATPQNEAQAYEGTVANLAKATEGDYSNLGTIIQMWLNLANTIR